MLPPFDNNAFVTSSLHGLSRVVTGQSRLMRSFWVILIITSFACFTWHASLLYAKFSREPVLTRVEVRGSRFEFPDLHLCPSSPIADSYIANPTNVFQFIDLLNEIYIIDEILDIYRSGSNDTDQLTNHILMETYFMQNLLDTVGHRAHQTVASLSIKERMVHVDRVEREFERNHKFCFKISVSSSEMNYMAEEVELVLYSDYISRQEDPDTKLIYKLFHVYDNIHYGYKLYFTKSGELPSYETYYLHIRPGHFYDIQLDMVEHIRYNSLGRPCFNKKIKFVDQLFDNHTIEFSDLFQSCIDIKVQETFVKTCGCYDSWLTQGFIQPHIKTAFPSCFNITRMDNISNVLQIVNRRYKCLQQFKKQTTFQQFEQICKRNISCSRQLYKPIWSYLKWPKKHNTQEAVKVYLKNPYRERRRIHKWHLPGWEKILAITDPIQQRSAFRETFSKLRIRPRDKFCMVTRENLQYPFVTFMSDIGGILGLYTGMSILTFFELVEVGYNGICLIYYAIKYRHNRASGREKCAQRTATRNSNSECSVAHCSSKWI